MTLEERDLRTGLRALAVAVPPGPPERAVSSVRRARRRRRNRAVGSVALAVALAAPVAVLAQRPSPPPAPVAAPAIETWPVHRDPALAEAEARAIASDTFRPEYLTPRVVHSAVVEDDVVVVWADCGPSACLRAVVAYASRDKATLEPEEGSSYWGHLRRDLVAGVPEAPLAMTMIGDEGTAGPTNRLFVLPPPSTTRVTWQSETRRPGTGGSGTLTRSGAAFAGDVGYLTAPAYVTATDAAGGVTASGRVDDDEDVPLVPRLPYPSVPEGNRAAISSSGQGSEHFKDSTIDGRAAVYVVCEGFRPVVVSAPGVTKAVPCDGRTHVVDVPRELDSTGWSDFDFDAEPYTALSYAIVEIG